MSRYYDPSTTEQPQSYPSNLEDLQELPEDPDQFIPQSYDARPIGPRPPELLPAGDPPQTQHDHGDASRADAKGHPKPRRRHPPGSDHVKHRRTRSGCYTCRQRRVKCDETRPICERCKKGGRDCTWPEPPSATKSSPASKATQRKKRDVDDDSSSEVSGEDGTDDVLMQDRNVDVLDIKTQSSHPLPEQEALARKQSKSSLIQNSNGGLQTTQTKEMSLSPSTDGSKSRVEFSFSPSAKLSTASTNMSQDDDIWCRLKPDQQFYLKHHQQYISHHYYFLKHDANRFIQNHLVSAALTYDPLLYAIVGFAAFHYALAQPNGKISDFLRYYNKSVSLLRKDLQSGRPHTDSTILTILQLATFEEYLGDWVNLMGHQRAANEMIRELYTPDSIVVSDVSRKILSWYGRFDLFAGLMAGNKTILGNEWLYAHETCANRLSELEPHNFQMRVESLYAQHRVLGFEMAQLLSRLSKREISRHDFVLENEAFFQKVNIFKEKVLSFRAFSQYLVLDFSGSPPADNDSIVDPYEPGLLFKDEAFVVNYLMIDCLAIELTNKYQSALILQDQLPEELFGLALKTCQIIEAISQWSGSPPGAFLPTQATVGLLALCLPPKDSFMSWSRRKFLKIENAGYVYPASMRQKLAERWSMPFINQWWLPDGEQQLPLVRTIRKFIEERTVKPRTQASEDIRAMKALISKLSIDESPKNSIEDIESLQDSSTPSSVGNTPSHYGHDLADPQQASHASDYREVSPTSSSGVMQPDFSATDEFAYQRLPGSWQD